MTTYVYETIPAKEGVAGTRYEIRQSMKDPALTHHPETGEPIRRVILGGFGILSTGRDRTSSPPLPAHCCRGASCGCAG